eukprot:TRINITY_DN28364_c0_g1_i1.p1 TRINITY_DN28364_c0_g1~~TRINITY_DN28364_c0_g1_i1.p1  ORF type:complete len:1019 (+),score=196.64 TRINITY_DN28364_c0_g1_i1:311-3058(+)
MGSMDSMASHQSQKSDSVHSAAREHTQSGSSTPRNKAEDGPGSMDVDDLGSNDGRAPSESRVASKKKKLSIVVPASREESKGSSGHPPSGEREEPGVVDETPGEDQGEAAQTVSKSFEMGAPSWNSWAKNSGGESVRNQYHFAFLDYYSKHYEAKQTPRRNPSFGIASSEDTVENKAPGVEVALDGGKSALNGQDLESPVATDRLDNTWASSNRLSGIRRFRSLGQQSDEGLLPVNPLFSDRDPMPAGKDWQREAAEIKQLLGSIRPFEEPDVLVRTCKRLMELLQQGSSHEGDKLRLVTQQGAVPIVEMLQVTDPTLLRTVLKVVNQIVAGDPSFQEIFAMVGLIPVVIKFARPHHSRPLRFEAACFVSRLCNSSARSLQNLVACGGLEALVDLVSHEYYNNRDLVWIALDALSRIFESAERSTNQRDFCRILAKRGLCGHLTLLIDTLAADIHERALQYLKVVVDLLLFFAREGDAVVKVYMASGLVLEGLIACLEFLPADLQVQICKIFKQLAHEPSVLNMLENAGLVPVLVHVLSWHCGDDTMTSSPSSPANVKDGTLLLSQEHAQDACSQCLLALFNLCKLSRPRQEQAALAGAAPLLQELVTSRHSLRMYAFVMLCDMTGASLATRRILWAHGGVMFLVSSLSSAELQTIALEAIVGWLGVKEHKADWCSRLEQVLLEDKAFLGHLLALASSSQTSLFVKILDPLQKLVRISDKITAALAHSDMFFPLLLKRLTNSSESADGAANNNVATNKAPVVVVQPRMSDSLIIPQPSDGRDRGESEETLQLDTSILPTIRRMASEPAVLASDDVRSRTQLLRLLQSICAVQSQEQLTILCEKFRLRSVMLQVLQEEKKKGRVILCEIASQLLELFGDTTDVEDDRLRREPTGGAPSSPEGEVGKAASKSLKSPG